MTRLGFEELDGLAFAAARFGVGKPKEEDVVADSLGPLIEAHQMINDGQAVFPRLQLALGGVRDFGENLATDAIEWVCRRDRMAGFLKATLSLEADARRWNSFRVAAHKAALEAEFPAQTVAQLIGALTEIVDNVSEHSQHPETGLVAFRASPGRFEFGVSDRGIGVLKSLSSCEEYAKLTDCGIALELMLKEGVTRFGRGSQHGTGFRGLFIGLANLHGYLRFRSGDHALVIDGVSPTLMQARLAQKVAVHGLTASVDCRLPYQ